MSNCNPYKLLNQYTHLNISKCSNNGGVYGFWFRNQCIYVGMTVNQGLRDRLYQHWNGSHNDMLSLWIKSKGNKLQFCTKEVDIDYIKIAEKYFIWLYQPLCNIMLASQLINPLANEEAIDGNCNFGKKR